MKGSIGAITNLLRSYRDHSELKPLTLLRFGVLLALVVALFSVTFHVLMAHEGQRHDWFTGIYWTLTTMTTLGYGDIVFQSDLGHVFSMLVLITGVILLLIVLPFAFIRFFYAPWLEAQLKTRVSTRVPHHLAGHVIICNYDAQADELVEQLTHAGIGSVVIESDPVRAASMHADRVPVVRGELGARATYENCAFERARLLLANSTDVINTNIVLTAREVSERVPIVATAVSPKAEAVLELAGANQVVLTTRRLGRHLANRVPVGSVRALTVGRYREVSIAEFPIRNTRLGGLTLRDAKVRTQTGVTVFDVAKRGHLEPGLPDTDLREDCIGLAVGSPRQVRALSGYLGGNVTGAGRAVVIGGGPVGCQVARALERRGAAVRIVERDPQLRESIAEVTTDVLIGDMTDDRVIKRAGIRTAASLVLTSNDDATNIFLAVYCRKLNPDAIIVSRITHPSNVEAIHRAGADFAVSDSQIKIQSVLAAVRGTEPMILGEGLDMFTAEVPRSLEGTPLLDSGILARTGLAVVAIEGNGVVDPHPRPERELSRGERVLFVGTASQRDEFERVFK
ncbi:MAG: potassium transporter TrkA [Gemmatimonadetes bacterium]|nr:potassium transporter TrkA [Gemmatimonadota bacterium]MYG36158.1 potassium transporter TrkA [Gemmatimonadota bacterium]